MRVALVFPAPANPAYVPMGIAALSGHLKQNVPDCEVRCFDLNVATWENLASLSASGLSLMRFLRGIEGDFYDEPTFMRNIMYWSELNRSMKSFDAAAKTYVETGYREDGLGELLDGWVADLVDFAPDAVCLSVMYLQQLYFALSLARTLKGRYPDVSVVVGGAALSVVEIEQLLLACPYVDFVVEGEGESAVTAIALGAEPSGVPGAIYRDETGIRRNRPVCLPSIRHTREADFSDFGLSGYFTPEPVLPVLYSRGCKWRRCRFCAHNLSWGRYREKAAEQFVDELETYVRRYGVRHFYFADQYIDAEDLEQISDVLIERDLGIFYHVMGRPTKDYTPERLQKMHAAGCRWISWGVESGSQRLLDIVDKGTTVEEVRQVVVDTKAAGISNLLMMIFGLPTGSDEDLRATYRFIESVYEEVDAFTASSFVLFDKTPFARRAEEYGLAVSGRELLFSDGETAVHSFLLRYQEMGSDGTLRRPHGPLEVANWQNRRRWLGDVPIYEHLCAEHYLLYACRKDRAKFLGDLPTGPRTAV